MTRPDNQQWEFGPFRLDGAQHLLFRDGKIVPLSRRATDMLLVLLENHGQLVEKDVLMRRVWPDSFVEESNLAVHISQLRKTLSEEDGPHRIETIPRRGYRFIGELNTDPVPETPAAVLPREPPASPPAWQSHPALFTGITMMLLIATAFLALHIYHSKLPAPANAPPPEKDTVVLADIANNTGDPVFDTTLRQAMAIELEQSPFLRLVSESRIQQTYMLMGRVVGQPLTPDLWRELCQRNGSKAVLDGWITKLGTQYVISVRAVNCRTGDHIADLQTTAAGKEQVLQALGDVTGQLRTKLGESLATVQRFDTPIEQATTPSLEALQAYSIGKAMMIQKDESSACLPFFQRAIRLDPDFAIAYAALGNAYSNLGETGLAAANMRRAYELRAHVSERERL
jgi:eukaryotic-like serine/threonine-protein kinase